MRLVLKCYITLWLARIQVRIAAKMQAIYESEVVLDTDRLGLSDSAIIRSKSQKARALGHHG